jgi:hypothetical protein
MILVMSGYEPPHYFYATMVFFSAFGYVIREILYVVTEGENSRRIQLDAIGVLFRIKWFSIKNDNEY